MIDKIVLDNMITEAPLYEPKQKQSDGEIILPNEDVDTIAETPDWEPPVEEPATEKNKLILNDDNPDTVANLFKKHSPVIHRYNLFDGWSIYSNDRYQRVDDPAEIEFYVRTFISKCKVKQRKKTDNGYKTIYITPDKKMKTAGYIRNVLNWLNTGSTHLKPSQRAPCSLDGKLNPDYIIPLKNVLLDWSIYPYAQHLHTPEFYTLTYLPYEWTGEVDSEIWIKFLVDATNGDVELFEMLQMFAGYCLGFRHGKQYFLMIQGEADTGKTVFCDVLTSLYGHENVSSVPLARFNEPHFMIESYGKILNVSDESEEMLLDRAVENSLKAYTGGTVFQFKRLYEKAFSVYPTAKILIATNHLPKFTDSTEGVWSRLLLAPFNNVIPRDKVDPLLAQKIIKTELGGVLKWALEGARKLQKNNLNFIIPAVSEKALGEYRREVNPEINFLEENFQPCDLENTQLAIPCKTFRQIYETWCKEQGIGAKSDKRLKKVIRKMFPNHDRRQLRRGDKKPYYYLGMMLSMNSEFYLDGISE